MATDNLNSFVYQVMNLQAMTAGMGGASAGIMGTAAMGDQTLYRLRKAVITFASSYRSATTDQSLLISQAKDIESALETLQMFSDITKEQLDQLLMTLQSLLDARASS